tara:strand:+ start:31307 stop:32068 length:762 start_codon:yes stop_codon:yes gene_type:complete
MTQQDKAQMFAALHQKGVPLVLYNVWDAGSARAVSGAGAAAIATGSWSVAAAQGYEDGQALPLPALLRTAAEIVRAVDLPVSIDFEGGYAVDPAGLGENTRALVQTGAIGLNFEDQVVGGSGLHDLDVQVARIAAIRAAADAEGVALFINARTDLFLQSKPEDHAHHVAAALMRARAFAEAGANGVFVPGLADAGLIAQVCAQSDLPVNVMKSPAAPDISALAACGVARISHGPFPYRDAMKALGAMAASLLD